MKHILLAALVFAGFLSAEAQKEAPKPNVNKAMTLAKQGKFEEAKAIVDGVPTHEKTMADSKSWLYRGVIYIAMDTSSFSKPGENFTRTGAEAIKKATELAGPKGKLTILDASTGEVQSIEQIISSFKNAFLIKGDKYFNSDDFKGAMGEFNKGLEIDQDTTLLRYGGAAAFNANDIDAAVDYLTRYKDNGGSNSQMMYLRVALLYEYKKDYEKALVGAREALKVNPNDGSLRQIELNCLLELQRYEEAKNNLLEVMKANPKDHESAYLLGALYEELKDTKESQGWFKKSAEINPGFMKAALAMARMSANGYKEVKQQMDVLDYKKDKVKLEQLDKLYVEKLRASAAEWEKCLKIDDKDRESLENLELIFGRLDDRANLDRIQKRMKALGYEN